MNGMGEMPPTPENINQKIEELLLSCDRIGEGGKAVVLKLSVGKVPEDFNTALEALSVSPSRPDIEEPTPDKAIKLLKLYFPNKGAFEYKMHAQAYQATQTISEKDRNQFSRVPALSSQKELYLKKKQKKNLNKNFMFLFQLTDHSLSLWNT